jgi:hypothetical protein
MLKMQALYLTMMMMALSSILNLIKHNPTGDDCPWSAAITPQPFDVKDITPVPDQMR